MKKYSLTDAQVHKIANLCLQEQGSVVGAKAEASLAANLLETHATYRNKFGDDIYSFMRNGGWFSKAAYWMDNGDAGESYDKAIRDVLVAGNRTLPVFVDEHDCFSDIKSATNNGKAIDKTDRSVYIRDVTIIKNRYGSTYTFWTFPTASSDPFGYTNNELRWQTETGPTAQDIIDKAKSYLGVSEPSGDDFFIRFYNQRTGSSFSMSDAWCAMFVSDIARMVGVNTDIIPNFADCDEGVRWFKDKGRYARSEAYGGDYVPDPGDVVFYSSRKTQSDSTHVGYVVSVTDQLLAIEGNHADKVGFRTIALADPYIIGYGKVAAFLGKTESKQEEAGGEVKAFQQWLTTYTGIKLAIDGKCGPATKKAAVSAMQKYLNTFAGAGLAVDGKFGPKSQRSFRSIKRGNVGAGVYVLQGLLYGHNQDPNGFDGVFGPGCEKAVRDYQSAAGLSVDGICGVKTFTALTK